MAEPALVSEKDATKEATVFSELERIARSHFRESHEVVTRTELGLRVYSKFNSIPSKILIPFFGNRVVVLRDGDYFEKAKELVEHYETIFGIKYRLVVNVHDAW